MTIEQEMFCRSELLLGKEAMGRIARKRVIIFGVGGVGSWCAESLVRSGIRQLTIVDSDCVCASNINRQLMATTRTVGQVKVDVLRERLLSINPAADITAVHEFFTAETAERFHLDSYDYIIDAIDSLKDKALLIRMATSLPPVGGERQEGRLFSSMGAALKIDPTRIKIAEFWKVQGDPLARALRKRFKREGNYPARKFLCVYSDELTATDIEKPQEPDEQNGQAPADNGTPGTGKGSLVHITAIFGFMLASLVVRDAVS
jgi:tRNA A37 threonylcarbamoyladenosine dehydratase